MKVIFLEDVPKVARAGDSKEVADGYARNFLLPKKLAVVADSSASQMVEAKLKQRARQEAKTEAEMQALAKLLEGKEITIKARSGAEGKLYGSVTDADIIAELANAGINVDKKKVEMAEPIHQLGNYEIALRLTKDLVPKVKLTVAEKPKEGE